MNKAKLNKLKDDTFWLRVLSVLIAIILWFYVNSIINPIKKKEIIIPIKYNLSTLSKGLVMTDASVKELRIVLSGMQDELGKVDERNIQATVDFSNVRQTGEAKLPINVSNPYHRVNIESMYPKNVIVNIDNLVTIQKDIFVEINGTPKKGYMIDNYQEEPNVISIKGAESDIKQIGRCLAQVNLSLNDRSFKASIPVKILDTRGKDITSMFDLSQKSVDVFVEILKIKQVSLSVKFKGNLPSNRIISKIELNPSTINIAGKEDEINQINEIVVGTIDTKTLDRISTFQFDFNIPKGLKNLDNVKKVVITIYTDTIVEKNIKLPVGIKGLDSLYEAEIDPKEVEVKFKIPQSSSENFDLSNFSAYVDASNLNEGVYNLPVSIKKPANIDDIDINPAYIKLLVKPKP